MTKKIYFDMDGVLATWNTQATLEQVTTKGYFTKCQPMSEMVKAVRRLISENYPVHILSSVFVDGHSMQDKIQWLKEHIPELKLEHMHFSPYGQPKAASMKYISVEDVLIDDFTDNLLEWPAKAIKVYNGINGTKGRWKGFSVHSNTDPELLYLQLKALIDIEMQ